MILLLVGGRPDKLLPAVDHFTAASSLPVQIHVVTDVPFVPGDYPISYRTHLLEESKLPEAALRMHRKFAKVTHGPGNIYMWKPLLHLLPSLSLVERAIVLDLDVFIPRGQDLAALYREFDAFPSSAVIGVAKEQQPTYDDNPHIARGEGRNGGVQLLHLGRMRVAQSGSSTAAILAPPAAATYASALEECSSGACGDIGYLGDQTFYSALATRHPSLLHTLPCGWNRQLSFQFQLSSRDWYARHGGERRFNETHACHDPCRLVHANQPRFKLAVQRLHALGNATRRASCDQCAAAAAEAVVGGRHEPGSANLMRMGSVMTKCCCWASEVETVVPLASQPQLQSVQPKPRQYVRAPPPIVPPPAQPHPHHRILQTVLLLAV